MAETSKPIEIINGVPHEVTLFMGDGKMYDESWKPGEPLRIGSRLLRPLIKVEELQAAETPFIQDIPPQFQALR